MMSLLRNRNTDDLIGSRNGLANPARPATGQREIVRAGLFPRGFAVVIAAALLTCLFVFSPDARAAAPKSFDIMNRTIEEKAPDFVLTDLDGRKFRLSDHRGKRPVLLIFSTTWCPSCKDEIPHLKSLHATYAKRGLEMVNIDIQESREKVAKFTAKNKLPYSTLLDEDGAVSGIYDIRGVPTLILVDKNGIIVCRQCRTVETLLDTMMKKK
ncbi:MAG: TlpA family protein disulfide reductase [Proteobacteria bacterium]|nr:TlpA family protein disulfide reductase [Pseudomonadota bacterium]MBU2227740.1 TlpA family protein disulfide reductase [Pseudomonadota bacterium]MBU2262078.1 TlpA family protein disulfide reductase [Pseudomonadota bacterium]